MKYKILIAALFLLGFNTLKAQTFTDSNLPIVIINTNGGTIVDEPKIGADLKIIFRGEGQRNYLTDVSNTSYLNYNGRIGIEIRGAGSANYPQTPYGIETRLADNISPNNVSILGMPSENDWILLPLYLDTSLMRDYLAYHLSRQLGDYAARGKYVEVMVNGAYQGLYILEEKIKLDKNRVDITEMLATDNTQPNLSGGFLIQENDEGSIILPHNPNTVVNPIKIEEPDLPTTEQSTYLSNYLFSIDAATSLVNPNNATNGFPSLIDTYSFYNYMLLTEFTTNPDSYTRSTYYHKDRNGKLVFGPVWDFNIAMNSSNGYNYWEINNGYFNGPTFLTRIFNNASFRCHLGKRWQELRQANKPFNISKINFTIDSLATTLQEAQVRHFKRWNGLGVCQTTTSGCVTANTHLGKVAQLKQFLANRASWIDANILLGYTPCAYPTLPNLVINEIMYNPITTSNTNQSLIVDQTKRIRSLKESATLANADDFEFIEIKNNETTTVNLTGLYFRGGGLVYQFPANSTIAAGEFVILASNSVEFQNRYGFAPFGQFSRGLSNTSENLILADAMGNTIDQVIYSDANPWPIALGKSIELVTSTLDNSLSTNWFAQAAYGGSPGLENVYIAPVPCVAPPNVIINEINYKSNPTTGSDWIEIYNAGETQIDLSGWSIKDSGSSPLILAPGTVIEPGAYLIFAEKLLDINNVPQIGSFLTLYPLVTNYYPVAFTFGLNQSGEQITLSDNNSCIIDQFTYGSIAPWPTSPNGQGYTLSFKNINLDNSLGVNWLPSTGLLGTPGQVNFEYSLYSAMYTIKSGDINDPTVWSLNRIPTSTDNITVVGGHILNIPTGTFSVKNIVLIGEINIGNDGILNLSE